MNDQTVCASRDTTKRTMCCHSTQTCCEGVCCTSSQTCSAITNANFVVGSPMVNTMWVLGTPVSLTFGVPSYSTSFGGGAWNGWKMQDGTTAEPWHMCSTNYLGSVATTRVILLPIGLVTALLFATFHVWKTTGLNPVSVAVCALLLLLLSTMLFFSVFWTLGIVVSLAALFAMAAGHKGGPAFAISIALQVFALAVSTAGLGLGGFFYGPNVQGVLTSLGVAQLPTWNALANCASYYDYFMYDAANPPYNSAQVYWEYCSYGWYTFLDLVADFIIVLQILMLIATALAHLRSDAGGKS